MGRERAADLQRAIGELSDASQQVLHLVRVEGLTLQDAALVMNRSYEATKKLYGRALARLAKRMDVDRKGRPEK